MRRRVRVVLVQPSQPAPTPAAAAAAALVPPPPAPMRGGRRAATLPPMDVALDEAKRRAREGDWGDATGTALVGLYAMCHELVYQVVPLELRKEAMFRAACRSASNMLKSHFMGNADTMAAFVKWAWERERGRAEWAKQNQRDRNRMSWTLQFSESLLTDYLATSRR